MAKKIAINGFGRIGRMVLRAILEDSSCADIEVAGINDLTDAKTLAHLFKYDSVHGISRADVSHGEQELIINGKTIKISAQKDPADLPWRQLGVDIVIESTGRFEKREAAQKHLAAGAKKVIISAPANDSDLTMVMGVNDGSYDPAKHHVLSNASCTTNCVAPVAKVLNQKFGIKRGLMTTIHSYTNDQNTLDFPHKDFRRARAAALSMIPTTTGAAKAVGLVLPELKGKLDGMAIRVPTPNVSLVDLVAELGKETTEQEVNDTLRAAAGNQLRGILKFEEQPLVSVDFNGNDASSIVDGLSTKVLEKQMVKVLAWYDNEWGYSNRVKDLVKFLFSKGF